MLTSAAVKRRAQELEFDLCGVAPAEAFPELAYLKDWLARGHAGLMQYMARTAEVRADAKHVLTSARSVVALGVVYNVDRPYSTELADPTVGRVARYAWGDDYHDVLGRRAAALVEWMHAVSDEPLDVRWYVDTGPVQERVYAQYAGLGWIGKNTCLINPELGSWMFLAAILCSAPLDSDAPGVDQCGSCTLCLEACPTGAIVEPRVLDARKCFSYLTIELRGAVPESQRGDVGAHVFGCDICQDVCPWNAMPARSTAAEWQPRAELDHPRLIELWRHSDAELRQLIKGSALRRTGVKGLRRNLAVAAGNSGDPEAAHALVEPAVSPDASRADAVVAEHAAWARDKLTRS